LSDADTTPTPEALFVAFQRRRDEATFRLLYRQVSPAVFGFALRLAGSERARAEDLLQEAWMRALRQSSRFRGGSLARWLSGIVVNCWREQRRKEGREELASPAALDEAARVEADWSETPLLQRAVDTLPDGFRAVLLLHDVEGFTHEEIAQMLAIDSGTSRSQLFRARRRLRGLLGGGARPPGTPLTGSAHG